MFECQVKTSIVGKNKAALFDPYKDTQKAQARKLIEKEITKVASNNWPKATAKLIKKLTDVDFNLDDALVRINKRVEYQIVTVGE
jgi:hypothetical protein